MAGMFGCTMAVGINQLTRASLWGDKVCEGVHLREGLLDEKDTEKGRKDEYNPLMKVPVTLRQGIWSGGYGGTCSCRWYDHCYGNCEPRIGPGIHMLIESNH
jgi:hypothetical protein